MNRRSFIQALLAAPLIPNAQAASALMAPAMDPIARATLALDSGMPLQACLILRAVLKANPESTMDKRFVRLGIRLAGWLSVPENSAAFYATAKAMP